MLRVEEPDVEALSTDLSGVFDAFIGGLSDRVQRLEERLATEAAHRKEAQKELNRANERIQVLEHRQDEFVEASSVLEANVDSLLTRLEQAEEERIEAEAAAAEAAAIAQAAAIEAAATKAAAAQVAAAEAAAAAATAAKRAAPKRSLFRDLVTAAQRQAKEKQRNIGEWSKEVDHRLAQLEAESSQAEDLREALHSELARQVLSAVSANTDQSKREAKAALVEQTEFLNAAAKQSAAFEQTMREAMAMARSEARQAGKEAKDAHQVANDALFGIGELVQVRERHAELGREVLKLRGSIAEKCDQQKLDELQEQSALHLRELEGRLLAESEAKSESRARDVEHRVEADLAYQRESIESQLGQRLAVLEGNIAEKLGAMQQLTQLHQSEAEEEGTTRQRLSDIQIAMQRLLELVMRIDHSARGEDPAATAAGDQENGSAAVGDTVASPNSQEDGKESGIYGAGTRSSQGAKKRGNSTVHVAAVRSSGSGVMLAPLGRVYSGSASQPCLKSSSTVPKLVPTASAETSNQSATKARRASLSSPPSTAATGQAEDIAVLRKRVERAREQEALALRLHLSSI
jgi:hypothetical protein